MEKVNKLITITCSCIGGGFMVTGLIPVGCGLVVTGLISVGCGLEELCSAMEFHLGGKDVVMQGEVELNIDFVQTKRDDAPFSPNVEQSVELFLQAEKRSGNTRVSCAKLFLGKQRGSLWAKERRRECNIQMALLIATLLILERINASCFHDLVLDSRLKKTDVTFLYTLLYLTLGLKFNSVADEFYFAHWT